MTVRIRGKRSTIRGLNREISKIKGRASTGLLAAALFVEGESNEIVPQKHGVLIGSSFASSGSINGKPVARAGYTAKYAPHVHEMPETNNFTKPDTGPKFLQKAVTQNTSEILNIIRRRIKV